MITNKYEHVAPKDLLSIGVKYKIFNECHNEDAKMCPFVITTLLPEVDLEITIGHFMRILFIMECMYQYKNQKPLIKDNFVFTENGVELTIFRRYTAPLGKSISTLITRGTINNIKFLQESNFWEVEMDKHDIEYVKNFLKMFKKYHPSALLIQIQKSKMYKELSDPDTWRHVKNQHFRDFAKEWLKH